MWYMLAPASRISRSSTSAIVVCPSTLRAASAASAKTPSASRPSGPSSSSTTSSTVIVERSRASSPIGTGCEPALRASSASASTAYGDLLVIESMSWLHGPVAITACDQMDASGPTLRSGAPRGTSPRERRWPASEPAALGGDQHRLGSINRTELAIDVVQVRAHGARGQRELVGDLLVDLALGEPLQHAELTPGQRTGVDVTLALAGRARQFVHDSAQLGGPEPNAACRLEHLRGRHLRALLVVGEHVREADEGGLAFD